VDRDLPTLIRRHKPRVLIMFGLAARTKFVRVEMLAHNRQSRFFPDADGRIPDSYRVLLRAPESMRGRAPFVPLVRAARAAGVDARLSRDAGRYICNYVYWRALEAAERTGGPELVVFVHVPKLRRKSRRRDASRRPTLAQAVRAATNLIIAANTALARR
jgi:pyroglutamyl-peptidase